MSSEIKKIYNLLFSVGFSSIGFIAAITVTALAVREVTTNPYLVGAPNALGVGGAYVGTQIFEKLDLDSKVQVTTGGEETKVVISTQHKKDIDIDELRINLEDMIAKYVNGKYQFDLNPSGSFVKGGPAGDT